MLARTFVSILALAVLMVVHEAGHYFPARFFKMKVLKFSIGFGPTLAKYQPKGSPTVFQIAIIPFLAYVQIAGMNPFEETDPKETGLYSNAPLHARVITIMGGSVANYLVASIFIFFGLLVGGRPEEDIRSMRVSVVQDVKKHTVLPAVAAGLKDGDKVISVNGDTVKSWEELPKLISKHPGEELDLVVERDSQQLHLHPVPVADGIDKGRILIGPLHWTRQLSVREALGFAVTDPPMVVVRTIKTMGMLVTAKLRFSDLSGPPGVVKQMNEASEEGPGTLLQFIGQLSAYLGAFNLLPIPALDGGRLLFLGIEAASRRKPDAKIEARIHAVGLIMMLALIAVVSVADIFRR